jgi:outer membrane protein
MHKVSKIFLLLSVMVALLVSDIPVASAEMSIRYVDIARVMRESKVGKKAQADLQANMTKLEKRLEVKKQEVLDLQGDIRKRSTVASEDEKRRMVEEFERKQLELEQEAKRAQEELNTEQQQLGAVMYKKVMDVVQSVSKDKGYDLVLELGGTPVVLYHQESNDITAEVLSALDASS